MLKGNHPKTHPTTKHSALKTLLDHLIHKSKLPYNISPPPSNVNPQPSLIATKSSVTPSTPHINPHHHYIPHPKSHPHLTPRTKPCLHAALLVFLSLLLVAQPALALNTDLFTQNYIIGYDPDEDLSYSNCPPGTAGYYTASLVSGDSNAAKIWNYIVNAGIEGVSNRPEVIAGIMGNLQQESSLNPFAKTGLHYGLYQSDTGEGTKSAVESALSGKGSWSWGSSGISQELQDIAIAATLDTLMYGAGTSYDNRFKDFQNCLDTCVTNTSGEAGAGSYAELFSVTVERNVNGHDMLTDSAVQSYVNTKLYPHNSQYQNNPYQELTQRRQYATNFFNEFSSASPSETTTPTSTNTSEDSATSGSNVTIIGDSITDGARSKLEAALPGVYIDAAVGKHFYTMGDASSREGLGGYRILENLVSENKLRDIVVFALGTNDEDGVSESQAQAVVDLVGPDRTLIFVTNRTLDNTYTGTNNVYKNLAANNSNVKVADYQAAIEDKLTDYLGNNSDGIHPNSDGQDIFVQTIVDTIKGINAILSASVSCTSYGSSKISEGGLTLEQAYKFAMRYGKNANGESAAAVGSAMWQIGVPSNRGSNCVTFSAFFIQKFAHHSPRPTSINPSGRWGNGNEIVDFRGAEGIPTGTEPQIFSVYQRGNSGDPHTAVVLGYHDGKWIVGHSSFSRQGYGEGDGTKDSMGAAFIVEETSDNPNNTWLWNDGFSNFRFAYFYDLVNISELEAYINGN